MHLHCFAARFHAIGMEPLWWIHFVLFFIFILGQDTVLFYLNFMRRGKRPATAANGSSNVELVVCKPRWLIEHWKVCLMVGRNQKWTRGRDTGCGGRGRRRGFR